MTLHESYDTQVGAYQIPQQSGDFSFFELPTEELPVVAEANSITVDLAHEAPLMITTQWLQERNQRYRDYAETPTVADYDFMVSQAARIDESGIAIIDRQAGTVIGNAAAVNEFIGNTLDQKWLLPPEAIPHVQAATKLDALSSVAEVESIIGEKHADTFRTAHPELSDMELALFVAEDAQRALDLHYTLSARRIAATEAEWSSAAVLHTWNTGEILPSKVNLQNSGAQIAQYLRASHSLRNQLAIELPAEEFPVVTPEVEVPAQTSEKTRPSLKQRIGKHLVAAAVLLQTMRRPITPDQAN